MDLFPTTTQELPALITARMRVEKAFKDANAEKEKYGFVGGLAASEILHAEHALKEAELDELQRLRK